MAVIDMGLDFSAAQEEAEKGMKPAPAGIYTVQVLGYKEGVTSTSNHKNIRWDLGIVNAADPDLNGKRIGHFTNIPDGGDLTGVGFLTQFLSAMGTSWEGTSFDPDSVIGQTAEANVTISEDSKWNNIESFV